MMNILLILNLHLEWYFEKLLHTKKIIVLGVYKSYYFEERPTPEVRTKNPDIKVILNTDSALSSSGLIGEGNINKKRTNTLKNEPNFYYVVTSPDKDFILNQNDKLFILSTIYPLMSEGEIILDKTFNKADTLEVIENLKNKPILQIRKKNELIKEIDMQGELKLRRLNESFEKIKKLTLEIKKEIYSLTSDIKLKISESINEVIGKIQVNNKLATGNI